MLIHLPDRLGNQPLYAVKPGANAAVLAARQQYEDAHSRNFIVSLIAGGIIGCVASALALASGFLRDGEGGLNQMIAVVFFIFFTVAAVGGGSAALIRYALSGFAEEAIFKATAGYIREAHALAGRHLSGYATDEEEWEAAHLANEAFAVEQEAFDIEHTSDGYPARLSPQRQAYVSSLRRKSQKLNAKATKLLDPKVTRRRRRKMAVVG